jgi:hypothetical protein
MWVIVPGGAAGTVYTGGDSGVLVERRDGGEAFSVNRVAAIPDARRRIERLERASPVVATAGTRSK